MKKLISCISLTCYFLLQLTILQAQQIDPSVIKADPDWQVIASIEDNFTGKFVNSKIKMENIDLTNEAAVLSVAGMTKDEYARKTKQVRDAANRLIKRYNLNTADCASCKLDIHAKNDNFKSTINLFQSNPEIYERFRGESLAVTKYASQSCCCCGFWFYACVSVCAAGIEVFPIYLGCVTMCYHAECCH